MRTPELGFGMTHLDGKRGGPVQQRNMESGVITISISGLAGSFLVETEVVNHYLFVVPRKHPVCVVLILNTRGRPGCFHFRALLISIHFSSLYPQMVVLSRKSPFFSCNKMISLVVIWYTLSVKFFSSFFLVSLSNDCSVSSYEYSTRSSHG